jgi:hypothetical protein
MTFLFAYSKFCFKQTRFTRARAKLEFCSSYLQPNDAHSEGFGPSESREHVAGSHRAEQDSLGQGFVNQGFANQGLASQGLSPDGAASLDSNQADSVISDGTDEGMQEVMEDDDLDPAVNHDNGLRDAQCGPGAPPLLY